VTRKSNSGLTGDQALTIVQLAIEADLNWIARAQPLHDYGIDMHAEPVGIDARQSGRLLGIQIKGGPAYFKRVAKDGWWHPISAAHAQYWLNHALPVVVILVNVELREAFWVEVNERTLVSTGKNYKVLVPRHQSLAGARSDWEQVLEARHLAALERFDDNISRLPPSVGTSLRATFSKDPVRASVLALSLAQAPDAVTAVRFALARPEWIKAAGSPAALAVANFCAEHGLYNELVDAHLMCANTDPADAPSATARAAIAALVDSPTRAAELELSAKRLARDVPNPLLDVLTARVHPEKLDRGNLAFEPDLAERLAADGSNLVVLQHEAARAMLQRDWSKAVLGYERYLQSRPHDSARMLDLARCHFYRSGTPHSQPGDADRALTLARAALDQRRSWRGPTVEALEMSARILAMEGRLHEALTLCQPAPIGSATDAEATSPEVVRLAALISRQLGAADSDIRSILERISDSDARADALVEFAAETVSAAEQVQLLTKLVVRAGAETDPLTFTSRIVRLAVLGVDRSDLLARLGAGSVPPNFPTLIKSLAATQANPGQIDPDLYELSVDDQIAAETLLNAYIVGGQTSKARRVARSAYERFHQAHFLDAEISILMRESNARAAEPLLRTALISGNVVGQLAVRFRVLLGVMLAERGQFGEALELFRAAAAYPDADSEVAWNAMRCAARLERWDDARSLIDTHGLQPKSVDEVGLWVTTLNLTGWTAQGASTALQLAEQYAEETLLASKIVGSVVNFTRSADEGSEAPDQRPLVPSEIRKRAFKLLADLADKAPGGPRLVSIDPDSADPLKSLQGLMSGPDPEQMRLLFEQTRKGVVPLGVLALVLNDPYALILAKRPLGARYASTSDGGVHGIENEVALSAIGQEVVVDLSILDLAPDLEQLAVLLSEFDDAWISTSAQRDLTVAAAEARSETASAGRLRWDPREEKFLFVASDPAEQLRVLARVEQMVRDSRLLSSAAVAEPVVVLPELSTHRARQSWVDSIEISLQRGLALWADDASLRNIARAQGVRAFGTVNLLESRRLKRMEKPDIDPAELADLLREQQEFVARLRELEIVDQPLTVKELLEEIRVSGGVPSPTSMAIGRAAWWASNRPLETWVAIRDAVAAESGDLEVWQALAMRGLSSGLLDQPKSASRACAAIAVLGSATPSSVQSARSGLRVAEEFAAAMQLPSPRAEVGEVVVLLSSIGLVPDDAAQFVADLLSED